MPSRFVPPARQLPGLVTLVIGATFASATWALPPNRAVALVEVPARTTTANSPVVLTQPAHAPEALIERRIDIGSATQALWSLQRNAPAVHPRPIDAQQAQRSYQRYLKSFETTIPEHYGSGLELQK